MCSEIICSVYMYKKEITYNGWYDIKSNQAIPNSVILDMDAFCILLKTDFSSWLIIGGRAACLSFFFKLIILCIYKRGLKSSLAEKFIGWKIHMIMSYDDVISVVNDFFLQMKSKTAMLIKGVDSELDYVER